MKKPRVLIVEDEPAIAELIAVNLRHNGFDPIWSEDGDSAQREIDAVLPDVILLDWMLPGESGVMLARSGSALPAALAQAGYSRGFEQEADRGAADYMISRGWGVKPLCDILERIDPEHAHFGGAEEAISTHPLTKKRIAYLQEHEAAAKALGLALHSLEVRVLEDFDGAFARAIGRRS